MTAAMKVAVLSYQGVSLFETACALELFGLARPEFERWYDTLLVTFDEPIVTTNVLTALTASKIESLRDFDLLIIPSWFTDNRAIPEKISSELHTFYEADKRIISFCSGAFLLASIGLFEKANTPATTHWRYADRFKSNFPEITYRDDVLYVFNGQIGCSAGSSAAIDLGLEVIRQDHNHDIANKVARRLVLSAHRKGNQAQFAESPVPKTNDAFSEALDWAKNQLRNRMSIDDIARQANMSRRNFDRKFKADFNITANDWLLHQKLTTAKTLLESSKHSIDTVADLAGFGTADLMRHHFRKEYGISPKAFRDAFEA